MRKGTDTSADKRYDAAISFLHQDEPLANRLYEQLMADGMSAFVYSKAQEQIAGRDGLEEFRQAFRRDCRLIIVLYRDGWGQTRWTRIEETAIKERCLADGWDVLLFVSLHERSTIPNWVPETHIRLNLAHYGFHALVGAVKTRIEQKGGQFKTIDAVTRAQLEQKRAEVESARRAFLDSQEGVRSLRNEVMALFDEIERLTQKVAATSTWKFRIRRNEYSCIVVANRPSLLFRLTAGYANRAESWKFDVAIYRGEVLLAGEAGIYPFDRPQVIWRHQFLFDVAEGIEWRWKDDNEHARLMTRFELADHCIQQLLKHLGGGI